MGFWEGFDDNPAAAKPPRASGDPARGARTKRTVDRKQESEAAEADAPPKLGCDTCALKARWPQLTSARMPMVGDKDADILVLGEGPGEVEDHEGRPFVGPSGQLLRQYLPNHQLSRLAWQNSVRCRPDDNRTPTPAEILACSTYLADDISHRSFKAILGVGAVPLSFFLPRGIGEERRPAMISNFHGTRFAVAIGGKTLWYYPILHPSFALRSGGERSPVTSVMAADIRRFFAEVDRWPQPTMLTTELAVTQVARDPDSARAILASMQGDARTIDFETSTLSPFESEGRVLCASISDGTQTVAFPINHPEASNDWGWPLVIDTITRHHWIAHNAAFELLWIWHHMGVEWQPTEFSDTMAYARFYHERETLLSLGVQSRIHLGIDVKQVHAIDRKHMLSYSLDEILPYCGLDAWATHKLYQHYNKPKMLTENDWWQVAKILKTIKSTTLMELLGLPVDHDTSKRLYAIFDHKRQAAAETANRIYEARQFALKYNKPFNVGSNQHVAAALVEFGQCELPKVRRRTRDQQDAAESGNYSTDDAILKKLAAENPLAKAVQDWREYNKLCTTYLEPMLNGTIVASDGSMHPGYTTMLTATLRLSGHGGGTNAQNWPKRKNREIRSQVKAPKGHVIVPIDEGQLEARVIAMASRDPVLCAAIIDGYDIHADWRDRFLNRYPAYWDRLREKSGQTTEKALLKAGRDQIKNDFVFASFYGSTTKGIAENTGLPLSIVTDLLAEFWNTFAGVRRWQRNVRNAYRDTGTVTTLTGRKRHALLWRNEPLNSPIQGTGADLVMLAQNEICDLALDTHDPYLIPRINLHDDLTFIWPDDNDAIEHYFNIVAPIMTKARFSWMVVPLMVEAAVGPDWAQVERFATYTGPLYGQHPAKG